MKNQKILIASISLSLIFSLSAIIISLNSKQQSKIGGLTSNSSCSTEDLLEIKMKIIARHTFNQKLGFSEGIYSLTEDDLNNSCIPESFKKEYKIAKNCYFSNKGCPQNAFFEELRKFIEIPISNGTN